VRLLSGTAIAAERGLCSQFPFSGAEQAEVGQWTYLLSLCYRYRLQQNLSTQKSRHLEVSLGVLKILNSFFTDSLNYMRKINEMNLCSTTFGIDPKKAG